MEREREGREPGEATAAGAVGRVRVVPDEPVVAAPEAIGEQKPTLPVLIAVGVVLALVMAGALFVILKFAMMS